MPELASFAVVEDTLDSTHEETAFFMITLTQPIGAPVK